MESPTLPETARTRDAIGALAAPGFPEAQVRLRARLGARAIFPEAEGRDYGHAVFGQGDATRGDEIELMRIVPNLLLPSRLETLIELGREPQPTDVDLASMVGGFHAPGPWYVSALGSTSASHGTSGAALARQAGTIGIPLVIGENVASVHGYRKRQHDALPSFLERVREYVDHLPPRLGGLVVQQSVEDANSELWNHIYSEPEVQPLLESGRLAFELKLGQGAKPGLGGLTLMDATAAERLRLHYGFATIPLGENKVLRMASPGTFTEEILRQQIRSMRNNYPRCKVWIKAPPSRDVGDVADVSWHAGADTVAVDGAEGGTGLAPTGFLAHVGLPLSECLRRVKPAGRTLLVSSRMWEGTRIAKSLALGATAVGLGRAALIATHEDPIAGFSRFIESIELELRMILSALGHYTVGGISRDDLWTPNA
jgi:methylamine---glutamate N-methyltransferase subunit C